MYSDYMLLICQQVPISLLKRVIMAIIVPRLIKESLKSKI